MTQQRVSIYAIVHAALHAGNARCQEEVLQQMGRIQDHVDYPSLRTQLLPRAHRLALSTTSAAVRAAAFAALAALAQRFCETEQSEAMVTTMQQVTHWCCCGEWCWRDHCSFVVMLQAFQYHS